MPALLALIRSNDLAGLQALPQSELSVQINVPDVDGDTPLHFAAALSCNIELVEYLVRSGANVTAVNELGFVPEDFAEGPVKRYLMVQRLLEECGAANCSDEKFAENFQLLVDCDAIDQVRISDGAPILHILIERQKIHTKLHDILKWLRAVVRLYPDQLHIADPHGNTAIHLAVQSGKPEIIAVVGGACSRTQMKASNSEGNTALHIAAMSGDIKCIKKLLERYIKLLVVKNKVNRLLPIQVCSSEVIKEYLLGQYLLWKLSNSYYSERLLRSIEKRGLLTLRSVEDEASALHLVIKQQDKSKESQEDQLVWIGELLARQPKLISAVDQYGYTPLHTAVDSEASAEVIDALLDAGARIAAEDSSGQTPLSYSVSTSTLLLAKILLRMRYFWQAIFVDERSLHAELSFCTDQGLRAFAIDSLSFWRCQYKSLATAYGNKEMSLFRLLNDPTLTNCQIAEFLEAHPKLSEGLVKLFTKRPPDVDYSLASLVDAWLEHERLAMKPRVTSAENADVYNLASLFTEEPEPACATNGVEASNAGAAVARIMLNTGSKVLNHSYAQSRPMRDF